MYRNLALARPAWHSSSYDFNLTAQLVTDGIRTTEPPRRLVVSTSESGVLPKIGRELAFDQNPVTSTRIHGKQVWLQVELRGGGATPWVDRLDVEAVSEPQRTDMQVWDVLLQGSDDGAAWQELGRAAGTTRPKGYAVTPSIRLAKPVRKRFYRVEFQSGVAAEWRLEELTFFAGGQRVAIGGPHEFSSAWMSGGTGREWVYVDLGAETEFDRVRLDWTRRAAAGELQVSDDAAHWHTLQALPAAGGATDELHLAPAGRGRYVRVLMMKAAAADGYGLSEMEVWGRGGVVAQAQAEAAAGPDGRLELTRGAWKLHRDSQVMGDGHALSQVGYRDDGWLIATVPGTVLASYLNAGAVQEPNFGDNQAMISDSYFHADFWYRNEFSLPASFASKSVWLHFDGINWKAEVYVNGAAVGRMDGAFTRGRFEVSRWLKAGAKNAIAVRVIKNATPGSVTEKTFSNLGQNGGALGADNPTFHASVGWDWIPTVRGRNTGIWNDVWMKATGPVTVDDAWVRTKLTPSDLSRAEVTVEATVRNHGAQALSGTLRGRFGEQDFAVPVTLRATEERTVQQRIELKNPRLWWPNGYGEPNLYDVQLRFETRGSVSDSTTFRAGVRQFTYSEEGGALRMWVNGRRFIPRGGNWGFAEALLRYRGREYDTAVRYHREMNFTMIRNWVGQVGDDEFYEACDRYGIVVWQDFWLANPGDGPNPQAPAMFLQNAGDLVRRIRSHASVGLYCGRNEGFPTGQLGAALRKLLAESQPEAHFILSSADDSVSGRGPYVIMPTKYYFAERATPKLHSEMALVNVPSLEALRAMMGEADLWPQGRMWALHDFSMAAEESGTALQERIEQSYGGADNLTDWLALAQLADYDGHRAMFEAQAAKRMGLLMWMSHPAWTSLSWQTYDYAFEPTAAYFACRKASEPLHIQWNPLTERVEVVNYSAGQRKGLTASVELRSLDGSIQWQSSATVDSGEDTVESPIRMEYPTGAGELQFIRLRLSAGGQTLSENFYLRGPGGAEDYRAIGRLGTATLESQTEGGRDGAVWRLVTRIRNTSAVPALMVRVKAVGEETGQRMAPLLASDNYVALMPGEETTIRTEILHADTRGEKPRIVVARFAPR